MPKFGPYYTGNKVTAADIRDYLHHRRSNSYSGNSDNSDYEEYGFYDDFEDFYNDHYDDFDSIQEAEEYFDAYY